MQPPINELPEGEWYCPPCQEVAAQHYFAPVPLPPQPPPDMSVDGPETQPILPPPPESNRETSVASSSRSAPLPTNPKTRGPGRPRNRSKQARPQQSVADESDGGEDTEVNVGEAVITLRTPTPALKSKPPGARKRGRPPKYRPPPEEPEEEEVVEVEQVEEAEPEDVGAPLMQARSSRKRKRELEPDSSPAPIPRVRLRLPTTRNGTKGKEKEEQEELSGMFDGILSVEDRDTSKTTITNHDKQLFERSRVEAEVRGSSLSRSFAFHP